jgi:hypothetical protein
MVKAENIRNIFLIRGGRRQRADEGDILGSSINSGQKNYVQGICARSPCNVAIEDLSIIHGMFFRPVMQAIELGYSQSNPGSRFKVRYRSESP